MTLYPDPREPEDDTFYCSQRVRGRRVGCVLTTVSVLAVIYGLMLVFT